MNRANWKQSSLWTPVVAGVLTLGLSGFAGSFGSTAQAADEESAADLLPKAVDPYDIGHQRSRFLNAAGIDTELDAKEFEADGEKEDGFVQSFDRWKDAQSFDRNRNGRLDWFEADAYRRDLRKRVLGAFDGDRNNRLTGAERAAANKALAAGKVPKGVAPKPDPRLTPAPPAKGDPGNGGNSDGLPAGFTPPVVSAESEAEIKEYWDAKRKELTEAHDKDGDGRVDADQRRAYGEAYRKAMQERVLAKFDANQNGEIDGAERKALNDYQRGRGELRRKQFIDKHDKDGDGELNEAERGAAREAEREAWRVRRFDKDGNGSLDDNERATMEAETKKWEAEREKRRKDYLDKYDKDGDGEVNGDERRAAFEDQRKQWMERRYDQNRDGKLDDEERGAMEKEMKRQDEERQKRRAEMIKRFDEDGDGELNDEERRKAFSSFGRRGRGRGGPRGGDGGNQAPPPGSRPDFDRGPGGGLGRDRNADNNKD